MQVLDKIKSFSNKVRNGEWVGHTGKPLKTVVCIGIGGSYLGPLFVHTALATDQSAMVGASGRTLRFLANVDPIDVAKALKGAPPPAEEHSTTPQGALHRTEVVHTRAVVCASPCARSCVRASALCRAPGASPRPCCMMMAQFSA